MLTIFRMETNPQQPSQPADFLHPFSGWDAAARWNQVTFDWMAKGFQQWVALMTTVPPHFLAPPALRADAEVPATPERATAQDSRATDAAPRRKRTEARPGARAEPRHATRPKAVAKPKNKKARTRG